MTDARSGLFDGLLGVRLGRRDAILALVGGTVMPWRALAEPPRRGSTLRFTEVDHRQTDRLVLPDGYRATLVAAWGTPLGRAAGEGVPKDAADQAFRFGYNCDFIAFFPTDDPLSPTHGLLCVNHESTDLSLMVPGRPSGRRDLVTAVDVGLEMAAQGHSVVELGMRQGRWTALEGPFNRRLSAIGPLIKVSGPAAGHARLRTKADPKGTRVAGTFANCAGGITPWSTVLSAEENIDKAFDGDPAKAGREAANHADMVLGTSVYSWAKFVPRFRLGEHPNEPNRFGWIVELDPRDPRAPPVKRTALGRFKHECATTALAPDGRVVVFMADDERLQHLYRFVTAESYDPTQHRGLAAGALFDRGTLSVARFTDDGRLEWRPLVHGQAPLTVSDGFRDQGDVVIETRRAARLMGATPLDRPEDVEIHPDGRIYVMFTKNDKREQPAPGAPRAPNPWGHVLEVTPPSGSKGPDFAADVFTWDVLFFAGDPTRPEVKAKYHPDTTERGWLACPDNGAFDRDGRLFITTDGAPQAAGIADGVWACDVDGEGRALTRRFLSVPTGAEATGPRFTPDGQTLFLSIQHPGQGSSWEAPSTRWPDFDPKLPPRPAVVAISREDGGPVGG